MMGTFNASALAAAIIFVGGLIGSVLGGWWLLAAIAFVVGLATRTRWPAALLLAGFVAGAALWALGALWFGASAGSLPSLIAQLFGVGSPLALGILVAVAGGLTAGLFASLGAYARAVVRGPMAG